MNSEIIQMPTESINEACILEKAVPYQLQGLLMAKQGQKLGEALDKLLLRLKLHAYLLLWA